MTDNFDILKDYAARMMTDDSFFVIHLIRRGKDHPSLPSANYTFKTYFIDDSSKFDIYKDEIVKCCDIFSLRAYMSVNAYDKAKSQKYTIKKYVDNLCMGEIKKPWRTFLSAVQTMPVDDSKWIVDVDTKDEGVIYCVKNVIMSCDSKFDNPVIIANMTRSGVHFITHPFNVKQFNDRCAEMGINDIPEIKKNHLTLLYENV